MSPLFLAIGTILGSIYFVPGDNRVFVVALICFFGSSVIFTTLVHRKKEILSLFVGLLLVFFNYNLRSEHLEFIDLQRILNHSNHSYLEIITPPKTQFFKSELLLELKATKPSLQERLREIFFPYRVLGYVDSSKGISQGDIVGLQDTNDKFTLEKINLKKQKYHKIDKVFYKITNKNLIYIAHKDSWVTKWQNDIIRYYKKTLSNENAAIVNSILLGNRVAVIPSTLSEQIRNLGLTHFFASSGSHLVMLGLMLAWLFNLFKLSKKIRTPFIIILSFIYTALAGFSPSIVRADILVTVFALLDLLKRKPHSVKVLVYLAAIILFIDPYTMFDIGFQLSYLATLAILVWMPLIKSKLEHINWIPNYIAEIIGATIAVQIVLQPLIMYYFDTLQIWSLIANLIFTPVLSLITMLAFSGMSFVLDPLLNVFKYLISFSINLPFIDSHININIETFVLLTVSFNLLAYSIFKPASAGSSSEKSKIVSKDLDQTAINFITRVINNSYTRSSIIFASICIIAGFNLVPPGINKLKIENGLIANNKEITEFMQNKKENFKYFKINNIKALIIKNRSSLKALGPLTENLQEVHLLLLPKLSNKDIYFDTLVDLLRPQFIIASMPQESPKALENIQILGSKANTIINSGVIYIGHDKFWSITSK